MNDTQNKPDGVVYVLSNRSFWLPEREGDSEVLPIVKIGYARPATAERLRERMGRLFKTGIALPFDLEYAKAVQNCAAVEASMHKIFNGSRINPNREFFHVEVESVVAALQPYPGEEITLDDEVTEEVTQSDIAARNRVESVKKRKLSFAYLRIQIGEKLEYLTEPKETATVVSDTTVDYKGETMSAAAAATKIYNRNRTGDKIWCSAFYNWRYKGETLQQIRDRIDAEKDAN